MQNTRHNTILSRMNIKQGARDISDKIDQVRDALLNSDPTTAQARADELTEILQELQKNTSALITTIAAGEQENANKRSDKLIREGTILSDNQNEETNTRITTVKERAMGTVYTIVRQHGETTSITRI
jgi:hypothetical protein